MGARVLHNTTRRSGLLHRWGTQRRFLEWLHRSQRSEVPQWANRPRGVENYLERASVGEASPLGAGALERQCWRSLYFRHIARAGQTWLLLAPRLRHTPLGAVSRMCRESGYGETDSDVGRSTAPGGLPKGEALGADPAGLLLVEHDEGEASFLQCAVAGRQCEDSAHGADGVHRAVSRWV